MHVRQAVFLVGGRGTRLGDLTTTIPKPMLEVAPGLRFLDVLLEEAARHGFDDILLLAGHMGDQVEAAYHGSNVRGAKVAVLREPEPRGTGGALKFSEDHLQPWFVLSNGDSLFEINLRALARPVEPGTLARIALRKVSDPARFGAVELRDGFVSAFREKSPDLAGPSMINGGIYLMRREIVAFIPGSCSIEQDIFPRLVAGRQVEGEEHHGYFIDIGLPQTYAQAQAEVPGRRIRPCAFLDRDGVLNVDHGYTHNPTDLDWIDGAVEAIRYLNDRGNYVIVVTNQSGVARGLYSLAEIDAFHDEMQRQLAFFGAHIDAFYSCPYHADGTVAAFTIADHPDRKPNPGMINKAAADWPIDLSRSFLIGDKQSDMEAGKAAGIRTGLFDGKDLYAIVQSVLQTV